MTKKQFEKQLKQANKIADLDKRFAKMTELMTQRKMSVANTIANNSSISESLSLFNQ